MFRNYFKTAWRNIIKSRFYSAVNILGLSVGIVFTLLISAYVWSELQVNKHLKNADRQYIIQSKWKNPEEGNEMTTLGPLAKSLRENYPTLVANYFRFDAVSSIVSKGDKAFRENFAMGDSTLLNMFGFDLLHGDKNTALNGPFKTVISTDKALKYFGKTDIIGQTITIQNFSGSKHDFVVSGVMKMPAQNSVTNLSENVTNEIFVSIDNLDFFGRNMNWQNNVIIGFIELQKGVSAQDLQKPMVHLISQNAPPQFASGMTPFLAPLEDYQLAKRNGLVQKMIFALSAIAFFILLMAVINFINMSVARSSGRMREIGIRKVLGGLKRQLILQFLIESVIIVFAATCVAFIFYVLFKDIFSDMLHKKIPALSQFPLYFIAYPIVLISIVGILGGLYPAFVLSSLRSVDSLKGKLGSVKENVWLRKALVGFQFSVAIIVLISAIIISKQINLFTGRDLGYDKDYILSAQLPRNWSAEGVNKMIALRNQFAAIPEIKNSSLSYEIPNGNNAGQAYIYILGTDPSQNIPMEVLQSDENFLKVYQIPMNAGTFFYGNRLDSGKVVLNETASRSLGFKNPQEAIGKSVSFFNEPGVFTVQGITGDFHFGSMQQKMPAVVFLNVEYTHTYRYISFKIIPGDISATIRTLQKKWNQLLPGDPFEYKFMDDSLARMYEAEIQLKKAAYTATILAIIIVLLGVLGLVSLSIQRRTREIGIRKVLGSPVTGIMYLFIKDFTGVILIGGLAACPVAFVLMRKWLQEYAYRVELTSVPFIIAISCLAIVTGILVCFQTIKAALANPVESLKDS